MARRSIITEEAVKKLDSKLECSVCLETLKEPKLLPCFHVFCKSPCLEGLAAQDPEGQSLSCPTCRHLVNLPESGVAGLQTDFHIEHLFEIKELLEKAEKNDCENCETHTATKFCQQCKKLMCDECTEKHKEHEDFSGHKVLDNDTLDSDTVKKQELQCEKHSKPVEIYCCAQVICSNCALDYHKDHDFEYIESSFPRHKKELVSSLEQLKEKSNSVQQALEAFDIRASEIHSLRTATETDIHREIDQLHQLLDQRRVELVANLDTNTQEKLKTLAAHRDQVETIQAEITSCVECTEAGLETGTEGEVLRMKAFVLERIEKITDSEEFDPEVLWPVTEANVRLDTDDKAEEICREFGRITNTSEKSYTTGDKTKIPDVDTPTFVNIQLMTGRNENPLCRHNLKLKILAETTTKNIYDSNQKYGRYLTNKPVSRGRYYPNVSVNKESPFAIITIPSPGKLHKPTSVLGGWNKPCGLCTNSKGHMIVVERGKHCVSVLEPDSMKIYSFGTQGSGEGEFNFPSDITVDQDDNIYVVDGLNHRIQKFTSEGEFVATAGSEGNNSLQFNRPVGICFNATSQHLYVCDQLNDRIQVLATDLTFVTEFGQHGNEDGQLEHPMHLDFNKANNYLYITDYGNKRVQVFTADGEFIKAFSNKSDEHKLEKPNFIAINSCGIVYVSEWDKNCVSVFTAQGEYITSFGEPGSEAGQFRGITGLCVDQRDSIIVSDFSNNRLQILQ